MVPRRCAIVLSPSRPSPACSTALDAWSTQIEPLVQEAAGRNGAPDHATWMTSVAALQVVIDSARSHRGALY